jgi:hypothetical protein
MRTLLCHRHNHAAYAYGHNPQGDYARLLTGTNGYISTLNLPKPLLTG